MSYYVLIAIAIAFAVSMTALGIFADFLLEWLTLPMSFEKAQRQRFPLIFWGREWLSEKIAKYHFAITGTTRSGKSLMLLLYLRSILYWIRPGSDRRLILFDPKNELHACLTKFAQVPVYYLLPTDRRSCRWDLARDFCSPAAIKQFCQAVVPDSPGDSNPFFTRSFRELMLGIMTSLNITQRGQWDLADVVRILESRDYTAEVLSRTPATWSRLRFMGNEKTWANIEATVETQLNDLRILAALWSRAETTFSLVDFVQGEGILVLGSDPRCGALLDPVNMLLLTQLFGHLLAQGDSDTRRTHLVIDELTVAAGEDHPLPGFKSICERGASRGVVVAVAYQSYADVKALYQESGDA
ncbi:MAG: type IV secretory system conjugative DNA transfer family protein, partial [Isosphaeraceae bacterium]